MATREVNMNGRGHTGRDAGRLVATVAVVLALVSCHPRGPQPTDADESAAPRSPRPQPAATGRTSPARKRDASDQFFEGGKVPELRLRVGEAQLQRLREDARRYVEATLEEDGKTTYERVAIKLKGAAGSFRELHDRPALTLNVNRHRKDQRFHDLTKFHLNNSVQDESYLCERICAELCRGAGLPAPRVWYARVWLNDRDLGLYVLKEAFDRRFLERHFDDPSGNLYDGGFLLDIDADLEKDAGEGPDDFSDLRALAAACREADPSTRWRTVAKKLAVDQFVTFMALERMTCHWDGYTCNRNNYRLYFDPATGKAHFLPHGMDQMFGDPGFPLFDQPPPIATSAVLSNPAWRKAYRKRVNEMLPLFEPVKLQALVDRYVDQLRPTLERMGPGAVEQHRERAREFKERVAARYRQMLEQQSQAEPEPLEFGPQGVVEVANWAPAAESENGRLNAEQKQGRVELVITANPGDRCVASWRSRVLLAAGRYRLSGSVRGQAIDPLVEEQGVGAGLRISGGRRENRVTGTTDWQAVSVDFEVSEPIREVVLVAELRARAGEVRFRSPLQLQRLTAP